MSVTAATIAHLDSAEAELLSRGGIAREVQRAGISTKYCTDLTGRSRPVEQGWYCECIASSGSEHQLLRLGVHIDRDIEQECFCN